MVRWRTSNSMEAKHSIQDYLFFWLSGPDHVYIEQNQQLAVCSGDSIKYFVNCSFQCHIG